MSAPLSTQSSTTGDSDTRVVRVDRRRQLGDAALDGAAHRRWSRRELGAAYSWRQCRNARQPAPASASQRSYSSASAPLSRSCSRPASCAGLDVGEGARGRAAGCAPASARPRWRRSPPRVVRTSRSRPAWYRGAGAGSCGGRCAAAAPCASRSRSRRSRSRTRSRSVYPPSTSRMPTVLDRPGARGDGVDEGAVMGDEHHRAAVPDQGLLEHLLGRDVEVVGGLVEEQEVGLLERDLAEQQAGALPAAQLTDQLVHVVAAEEQGAEYGACALGTHGVIREQVLHDACARRRWSTRWSAPRRPRGRGPAGTGGDACADPTGRYRRSVPAPPPGCAAASTCRCRWARPRRCAHRARC